MHSIPVAIVGAGPVGLSLALGLARQGVRCVVVEREEATSGESRAPGVHVRTREALGRWGLEERFLEAGVLTTEITLHSARTGRGPLASLDFSEIAEEAHRPGLLILEQSETERLLLEAALETGLCEVRFRTEAVGVEQRHDGVHLTVRDGEGQNEITARYLVGCDGANSFVRESLGLPFEGITYSVRPLLTDVRVVDQRDDLPWPRVHNGRGGITVAIRLRAGLWRLIRLERGEPSSGETVGEAEVQARLEETLGPGPCERVWASRFRIHRRASPRFRVGRVLLAGDAAHVHSPVGGLGMNGGIQDAHDLAWKLAHALHGGDEDRLLDAYEVERKAVIVDDLSRYTDLLTRTFLDSPTLLREIAFFLLRQMLRVGPLRRRSLRRSTMLDLDYPPSPLLDRTDRSAGIRLTNPVVRSPSGTTLRLHTLLDSGPAILDLTRAGAKLFGPPVQRVIRFGEGRYTDPSGAVGRLLGGREGWILVRPDGHVAWARDRPEGLDAAIREALGFAAPG
jgi:2-polyprenyl-6-methoxyphenol hydroxylase-like FAD-dependent oxidoreductase